MLCRLCGGSDLRSVLDLGATPPCERFLSLAQLDEPEMTYPLHLRWCAECRLAQVPPLITPEQTFTEYAYFSSFSSSWVEHARRFVADALARTRADFVVEVASNDGYLLQHVVSAGVRCLGIEPSVNVGEAARARSVPTHTAFLDAATGSHVRDEHGAADLVVANNVYAHIPDILGFTKGLRALVADDGWVSIEVAYLADLLAQNQYDTIYHEHFQYYTVESARAALASGGLRLVDVEHLDTHGGSLRLWSRPIESGARVESSVEEFVAREHAQGLHTGSCFADFAARVTRSRTELLRFLLRAKADGKMVVGYGAPGKGNTLLNYCGVRQDLLPYTVDRNPYKHGKFTPGTRIPVLETERIALDQPDYVLVLPWNLRTELTEQLRYVEDWGGRLVFPVPDVSIAENPVLVEEGVA